MVLPALTKSGIKGTGSPMPAPSWLNCRLKSTAGVVQSAGFPREKLRKKGAGSGAVCRTILSISAFTAASLADSYRVVIVVGILFYWNPVYKPEDGHDSSF